MTWIHEHPQWPSFTWDDAVLATKLAEVRHRQGRLLGRMESLNFALRREASLGTLTDEVVKSSAIEGESLDREQVRSSIARRLGVEMEGLVPSSVEVDGVVEMMIDATQHYEQPLTAERLFGWHEVLFPEGHSGSKRIAVGAWRPASADAMQVISGPPGRERVHFEAPMAARLVPEMAAFLEWFEAMTGIDPVLRAGLAHLWFVTVHPFEDGNGRIARAITDLALARADGSRERFYSLATQFEADRKGYYLQLERQQRATPDITWWLSWFLDCLGRAVAASDISLSAVLAKAKLWELVSQLPVNGRQRLMINQMLSGYRGHIYTSKYAELTQCSTDTASRDIRELLERGILLQNPGGGRSTSYRLAT